METTNNKKPFLDVYGDHVAATDDAILWYVIIPGISKEHVKVTVEGNYISVSSSDDALYKVDRTRFLRFDRKYNLDAVDAKYYNGILEINIPKFQHEKKLIELS